MRPTTSRQRPFPAPRHPGRLGRRDFLGMAAAAGAGVPLLGSCAGGDGDTDSGDGDMGQVDVSPPREYEGREHNVVIWSAFGGVNGEAMDALIKRFNDSQGEIYAEVQFQGSYGESAAKLVAAVQVREVPDIAILSDAFWSRLLFNDLLEPFDDYFDDQFNKDIYIENLVNEGVAGDQQQLYWMSFARSTPLFLFNRDRFAEAGLPDRGPETWTELREWGEQLVELDAQGQPLKVFVMNAASDWHFQAIAWEFGGRVSDGLDVTIDTGGSAEAAEWLHRFFFDDNMGYVTTEPFNDFANGITATGILSTGVLGNIYDAAEFEVGASPLPAEHAQGVPTGGAGLVMLKGIPQERRDAAVEVVKFLATAESSAEWTLTSGYMPIVKAALEEPALTAKIDEDPNFGVALDQLPIAQQGDPVRLFVPNAHGTIDTHLGGLFTDANADPQQALSALADELREAVEEVEDAYNSYF